MSIERYKWVNLLRHLEQEGPEELRSEIDSFAAPIESELRQDNQSFSSKVSDRAGQVTDLLGLRSDYETFSQRSRSFSLILFAGMALLGFFAVMQTLSSEAHTLNVYWLLLILLGINAVSMILWVVVMLRSTTDRNDSIRVQSPLTRLYRKILSLINRSGKDQSMLASWAEVYLFGQIGKWFTSKNLHAAWLMYLAGGLLALLIALSGKQYDFVWGTTILGADTFVTITQSLATIPGMLGFPVPSAEQVLISRQGSGATGVNLDGLRNAWAGFLFACILVYALLPRILLWLVSILFLKRAESRYEPDWDLPYFYRLRIQLLPESTSLGVVDKDAQGDFSPPKTGADEQLDKEISELSTQLITEDALVAAYEWGSEPLPELIASANPPMINDAATQQGFLDSLAKGQRPAVILVPLERAADRGAARFFSDVMRTGKLTVLVVRRVPRASERARWAGWLALAERIKLPSSQLILVHAT